MKRLTFKIALLFFFSIVTAPCAFSHNSWEEHANDMMAVFGFQENPQLRKWMQFLSSDMIDNIYPFYSKLQDNHPGFACKHRLLFHWGYDAEPWNSSLEARVIRYCNEYDLNIETNIRIFKSEIKEEQKRRNRIINQQTETLFGFAHGGKDASFAHFFASMAYNIHLIGDYTSDNSDLDGLQNISNIIGLIVIKIRSLDNLQSKNIIKGITKINNQYSDPQKKADALMAYLKAEMPDFIKKAQNGSIYRRLQSKGFYPEENSLSRFFSIF